MDQVKEREDTETAADDEAENIAHAATEEAEASSAKPAPEDDDDDDDDDEDDAPAPARNRLKLILIGVSLLVVLVLAGFLAWHAMHPAVSHDAVDEKHTEASGVVQPPALSAPASGVEAIPPNDEAHPQADVETQQQDHMEAQQPAGTAADAMPESAVAPAPAADAASHSSGEVALGTGDHKAAAQGLKEAIEAMNAAYGDKRKPKK